MRSCWNWQTGMTKDHVLVGRVGSSPILRMSYRCCIDDEIGCTAFSYFKENEWRNTLSMFLYR